MGIRGGSAGGRRLPGCVDPHEGHGLEASLLRKLPHKVHQSSRVVKLAQVDVVSHGLPVGHDPHLETHTNGRYSLSFPSFFSSQTACSTCGRVWCHRYDTMFYIGKVDGHSSHGRFDFQPPASTQARLSNFPVPPPPENPTSLRPDQYKGIIKRKGLSQQRSRTGSIQAEPTFTSFRSFNRLLSIPECWHQTDVPSRRPLHH